MKEYIVLHKEDRAHQIVHADAIAIDTDAGAVLLQRKDGELVGIVNIKEIIYIKEK
tara:strand:+ start:303 stop:470 length:168 start_codon:yes stop_codon:yes gene_type:complete